MSQPSEFTKTSLLVIATIFTGAGASVLTTDIVKGCVLLFIAIGVLILRGVLKHKGIVVNGREEDEDDSEDM